MDLKTYGSVYFFVIVDLFTKYSVATVIQNKKPATIICNLYTSWISLFGSPRKILSDNGGEFNNSEMRDLGEAFNIKIMTTSAESPWSNGVCERLNAVLGSSVDKIVEECNCDLSVALSWAVSSRNALNTYSGFSPNQLVFGFNPALPGLSNNELPALENVSVSETVQKNLAAMHSSRVDYMRVESNARLQRAMRHNIRESDALDVENGDEVYYKRNDSNEWRGPGVVIGRDGKQVLVKHGGVYVRAHVCRLTRVPFTVPGVSLNGAVEDTVEPPVAVYPPVEDDNDIDRISPESDEITGLENNVTAVEDPVPITTSDIETTISTGGSKFVNNFKVGQRISGVRYDTGELFSGKIISRAGKAKGKYGNCFNVCGDADKEVSWYDLRKDFSDLKVVPDEVEMVILFNCEDVMNAKQSEIQNWKDNNVYKEVDNNGQDVISVRWVITEKIKEGKTITKARLVARGFEENTDNLRKDSPTCSKEGLRLVLALAATKGWECHSLDVKAAYLQGNIIERDIYLRPPPEYNNGQLWKLNKTVYGLCDAARAWYLRVKQELLSLGVKMSSYDSAIFSWVHHGNVEGLICVYVDDFLWVGTHLFETKIVERISGLFNIGTYESGTFKYVGLNILSGVEKQQITVDQLHYASSLKNIPLSRARVNNKNSDLTEKEKSEYRSLIGQLNWIATQTRPDIAFDTCALSGSFHSATVQDLVKVNKIISRVVSNCVKISFPRMNHIEDCHLACYSDASFANLSSGGSQGGMVIFLKDSDGKQCPIYWQTRKIRRVVKSTLAAETLALLDCAEAAVYIASIIADLINVQKTKVCCYVDNRSLVDALHSLKMVEDRRLRLDIAVLQDMMERGELNSVSWVDTGSQLANCLTKGGVSAVRLLDAIGC